MGQYGHLIPDRYVREVPNEIDMNTASIFWGFSLCAAVFTLAKGTQQSWRAWKRRHRVTAYVGMIWVVWLSSMVLGCLAWGFQRQYIAPSFGFYFSVAFFWALQVQFLLQIIINRIGLLMVSKARATRLKWIVFVIILLVNISVFVIWMPARLQISDRWVRLNAIWDRCEKVIFAVVDGVLNGYFVYLVRSRLIENGLTKYIPLYRMNLGLIGLSLSLDIVLVGLMSLPSSLVYLSFHPVAYLLKLQIEMKMAELITKIVRSSGTRSSDEMYHHSSNMTHVNQRQMTSTAKAKPDGPLTGAQGAMRGRNTTLIEGGDLGEFESSLETARSGRDNLSGIVRTIETTVDSSPAHVEPSSPTEAKHSEYAQSIASSTFSGSKTEATEKIAIILASTGCSEYLISGLLIINHQLTELLRKIHHQKMQRHRQLFNNACEKAVISQLRQCILVLCVLMTFYLKEWEDEVRAREKEEGEKEEKRK
ncbi:hypothetical protein EDB82DRAFT_532494 [Fusarium venenatum]|uniref:uncharacterized protein n=1 Tax=Fusarium venenatum TaxID=56646 RepID=UPI001DA1C3F1|nr:hypothetical protein EDB82DRAFT_532494 [Fusarium venenatum]